MIEVKAIAPRKRDLLPFVKFPIRLYRGNPCYVPPLVLDEVATLSPDKNPAFDFCEAQCFMAYRDGKPAGRIAAIINRQVNERTGNSVCHLIRVARIYFFKHGVTPFLHGAGVP